MDDLGWTRQQMYDGFLLVMDEFEASRLKKQRMRKMLKKDILDNEDASFANLEMLWKYRLCCASLLQHRYNWVGFELRNEAQWMFATQTWCYPRWDGSPKNLLVVAEQGIGDEILFASCYRELFLQNRNTWIEVEPRLLPIMRLSFHYWKDQFIDRFIYPEGKKTVPNFADDYPRKTDHLDIEAFIPAGNVPKLFRKSVKDFPGEPFLRVDGKLAMFWKDWLVNTVKKKNPLFIGLSWKGRQGAYKPNEFQEVVRKKHGENVVFVNLQYDEPNPPEWMINPPVDLKDEIEQVFALVKSLACVVTVPNAVAHIAGSQGVLADVIKPHMTIDYQSDFNNRLMWQWPHGTGVDQSDWYPYCTVYKNLETWARS